MSEEPTFGDRLSTVTLRYNKEDTRELEDYAVRKEKLVTNFNNYVRSRFNALPIFLRGNFTGQQILRHYVRIVLRDNGFQSPNNDSQWRAFESKSSGFARQLRQNLEQTIDELNPSLKEYRARVFKYYGRIDQVINKLRTLRSFPQDAYGHVSAKRSKWVRIDFNEVLGNVVNELDAIFKFATNKREQLKAITQSFKAQDKIDVRRQQQLNIYLSDLGKLKLILSNVEWNLALLRKHYKPEEPMKSKESLKMIFLTETETVNDEIVNFMKIIDKTFSDMKKSERCTYSMFYTQAAVRYAETVSRFAYDLKKHCNDLTTLYWKLTEFHNKICLDLETRIWDKSVYSNEEISIYSLRKEIVDFSDGFNDLQKTIEKMGIKSEVKWSISSNQFLA